MKLSEGSVGVLSMVGAGLFMNASLAFTGTAAAEGWSDSMLTSLACTIGLVFLLPWLFLHPRLPSMSDAKWILSVGFFGAGSLLLMFIAIQVGIPLGDFAAMNSTNTVFAAFLGRLFLSEALQWPHYAAVVMSVGGALLISQPEAVFGRASSETPSGAWIGYILALISGFCDACVYVSSRKASHVSPMFIHVATASQLCVANFAFAWLSGALDFEPFAKSPSEAALWLLAVYVTLGLSLVLFLHAAQTCPAAVSATVDTATRMTSGYFVQALLFGAALTKLTLVGAGLMLASVACMALVRSPAHDVAGGSHGSQDTGSADADDEDSLASFAASEFTRSFTVSTWSSARRPSLRQRHPTGASEPSPEALGAASAAAALPVAVCLSLASA